MEFSLIVYSELDINSFINQIDTILNSSLNFSVKALKDEELVSFAYIHFTCFISREIDEIEGDYLKHCFDEFGINGTYSISIQLFRETYMEGLVSLFGVIRDLLKNNSGDLGLIGTGNGMPIFKRTDNVLWAANNRSEYYFDFPFYEINPDLDGYPGGSHCGG